MGSEWKPSQFPEGSRSRSDNRVNWKETHKQGSGWLGSSPPRKHLSGDNRGSAGPARTQPPQSLYQSHVYKLTWHTDYTGWQPQGWPNHTRDLTETVPPSQPRLRGDRTSSRGCITYPPEAAKVTRAFRKAPVSTGRLWGGTFVLLLLWLHSHWPESQQQAVW